MQQVFYLLHKIQKRKKVNRFYEKNVITLAIKFFIHTKIEFYKFLRNHVWLALLIFLHSHV